MKNFTLFLTFSVIVACGPETTGPDAYGHFEADELRIASETAGRIIAMPVGLGDPLAEGDLIAVIDTAQFFLQKQEVRASIEGLKSKLQNVPSQLAEFEAREEVLLKELKRVEELLEDGAATQKQRDDIAGELEVVQKRKQAVQSQLSTANRAILAQIEPLKWKLRQLEDGIKKSMAHAPADGTVLAKYKARGEMAGPGQPMIKMASLDEMTFRGYISGRQLSQVRIGAQVGIYVDGSDGELIEHTAEVTWVSDKSEFTPKTIQTKDERINLVYALKARVSNDGSLKIGMPAELRLNGE